MNLLWLKPTWGKAVFVLAYFLFFAILDMVFSFEWMFLPLSWSFKILPWSFIAAFIELAFAYLISSLVLYGVAWYFKRKHS